MREYTTHRAYCSACDREVTIGLAPDYELVPGDPIDASAVICHGLGEWCTGELCPLFGLETAHMRERFEKLPPID